jgi:putative DNA primase/helicase
MFRRYRRPPFFAVTYPSAREIAARLKGETRPDGSGNYSCHCPGPMHKNGDANPSLSVKDGANGRPLLYCFAGCDFRDIVAALERQGILPRRER